LYISQKTWNKQKIIEELKKEDNMGRAISAYDYIIAEGRKEGILTGLVTGRQEGKQEGLNEGLNEGLIKGLNEGLIKGLEEKERIVTINMWEQKLSIELIANFTLTPLEKVFNILYEYLDKDKVMYIENLLQEEKSYQEIAQTVQMNVENVQRIIEQFILPLQQFNLEKQKQSNDKP
jgi:predicted transposase YdaD